MLDYIKCGKELHSSQTETDLNLTDLEELKQLVEQKIKTQKKSK